MLRLEDQRLVKEPNPPPPAVLIPATATRPAVLASPSPSDLIQLLNDEEGRVRRRAALALGRVGLFEGVGPLADRLANDEEFEVRQMAAFALGLIGSQNGRTPLLVALNDASPVVQGRAAEALGLIGSRDDAPAVSAMVARHIRAGVLAGIQPDALEASTIAADAARLGIFALVRLGAYDALAAAVLDAAGQPVSTWWPIAYALQRSNNPGAATPLLALLPTPGRFTAAFAARGLAALKPPAAAESLRRIVEERQAPRAVLIQAIRGLGALADAGSIPALQRIIVDPGAELLLRVEALEAFALAGSRANVDLLLDLLSESLPGLRGAAMRALARLDPDTFILTLSGLDPDREWSVRVAQVNALATLPADVGSARLLAMLQDRDQRVTAAVLAALVAIKAPEAAGILTERLAADDFGMRATAAAGLAELRVTSAVPALVAAYRAGFGDSTYVARAATLAAIHRLDPAAARPLLQEALEDREWAVRVRAVALLEEQGVQTPAERIRPAVAGKPVDDPSWQAVLMPQFSPHAFIETDRGVIEIELAINDAPQTVMSFMTLARKGFYNGMAIHRVVPDFVVQAGDPRGDGEGGPGYTLRDELNERPYLRGTVGMALDWKDTGGSQFFITHSPQPQLDARYTAFGTVVDGIDVAEQLVQWDVIRRVRIWDGVTMTP